MPIVKLVISSRPIGRKLCLLFIVFSLFITTPALAQTATPSAEQNYQLAQYAKSSDNLFIGVMHTIGCIAFGSSIVNQPCLTPLQSPDSKSQSNGGLLGFVTNTIVILYANPPLRTASYMADIKNNLIPAKPAYAQVGGGGQGVIEPIKTLWEVSRNIAYIIMIIIFVVIGLMIMFRAKINPQTVISVQAALPGLVIGLILITFSYFIAALLVDVAFISTWVVGYYFMLAQSGNTNIVSTIFQPQNNIEPNILTIFTQFFTIDNQTMLYNTSQPIIDTMMNSVPSFMGLDPVRVVIVFLSSQILAPIGAVPLVGSIVSGGMTLWSYEHPPLAFSVLLWVFVGLIFLYTLIRLLIRLVTNYIMILFLTFFAPFTFLFASLPGRQGLAIDWARNMLCNVLAFPSVFAALYFAAYIAWGGVTTDFNITAGLPLIGGGSPLPLLNINDSLIRFLLVFGILLATPAIPDVICNAIGTAGRPGSSGAVIGKQIEGGVQGGQGYTKTLQGGGGAIGGSFGGIGKNVASLKKIF